nr:helix-turn-helix family protein [uncultured Mediterranean phage uvMED]
MSKAKDKILNKTIGQKIREARMNNIIYEKEIGMETDGQFLGTYKTKKKTITQSKLGKALGVTFQQIQKYESGHNALSSLKLLEVSNFFNKPLEYFTSDATELLEKVRPTDNSSVKVSESLENV